MSIPFENTNYNSGGGGSTLGAGTGINVDNNTITNTLPDQTVILEPGTGINITGTYPEFTVINTLPNQQSNFTQTNASAVSFISNKPIITTSASVTSVGVGTGANAEGNHTAFGKNSAKQALQGHLCLGEESGEQGGSRAISIGYRAHATNAGSTVISASDSTLSSSANDAFFMEKLRTIDPNGLNVAHMKINMYNTSTKEIFNVDNLLVPGTCKINGTVQFGSTAKISINSAGAIGFGSTPQFGVSGTVLLSGAATGTPAWGVLDYSSLSGRPTALSSGTGINIVNNAITNTSPNVNGDFTQATSSNSAFILNKPIITTSANVTSVGVDTGVNAEGNHTAFGKLSAKQAMAGHLCLGEESGEQGGSRAISIGYKAHATNAGSTVISSGGTALSSSANDAFFMEKLRTLDPNGETLAHMKINMYNTDTKEIFNVDNLLVPGTCKINGAVQFGSTAKITINSAGAIGFGSTPQFGTSGYVLISGAATGTPAWGQLDYSSLTGKLTNGTGISIVNGVITNTLPNVAGQAPLQSIQTNAASGAGALTLTSGTGYNTLLTFTPADTVTNATNATNSTNATVLVGGHDVVCVSTPALGGGGSGVPYLYSRPSVGATPVNNVYVYFADNANKAPILTGQGYDITVTNSSGVPLLHSNAGNGYPNNVHVHHAALATLATNATNLTGGSPTFTGTVRVNGALNVGTGVGPGFTVGTDGYVRLKNSSGTPTTEWDPSNGNIVVTGLYYIHQIYYSDDRIKSQTIPLTNATETIMKLNPVQYKKHPSLIVPIGKEDTDLTNVEHFTESGFVAQEIEAIPELAYMVEEVKYKKDNLKGIKNTDLIAYLVKGLQEMNERIKILESK